MKLTAKSFPATVIGEVLDDLAQKGLQSDSRYAEAYARSRAAKGYGARRIVEELRQRGIPRDDQPELQNYDWNEAITRVYTKKYGHTLPQSFSERVARENFLRVRGFSGDQIRHLLLHLIQS